MRGAVCERLPSGSSEADLPCSSAACGFRSVLVQVPKEEINSPLSIACQSSHRQPASNGPQACQQQARCLGMEHNPSVKGSHFNIHHHQRTITSPCASLSLLSGPFSTRWLCPTCSPWGEPLSFTTATPTLSRPTAPLYGCALLVSSPCWPVSCCTRYGMAIFLYLAGGCAAC